MRRGNPARAGQPVAIDEEDLVRDRLQSFEPLKKILVMEPADAGAISLHQPRPVQDEGASADPNERDSDSRRALEEAHRIGMQVLNLID